MIKYHAVWNDMRPHGLTQEEIETFDFFELCTSLRSWTQQMHPDRDEITIVVEDKVW